MLGTWAPIVIYVSFCQLNFCLCHISLPPVRIWVIVRPCFSAGCWRGSQRLLVASGAAPLCFCWTTPQFFLGDPQLFSRPAKRCDNPEQSRVLCFHVALKWLPMAPSVSSSAFLLFLTEVQKPQNPGFFLFLLLSFCLYPWFFFKTYPSPLSHTDLCFYITCAGLLPTKSQNNTVCKLMGWFIIIWLVYNSFVTHYWISIGFVCVFGYLQTVREIWDYDEQNNF